MKRHSQVEKRLRESGYPGDEGSGTPRSGPVSSLTDLAATIAHNVNNPLCVVVANLDFLSEAIARLSLESDPDVLTPESRARLAPFLLEVEACLRDARQAAGRIQSAVAAMRDETIRAGSEATPGPPDPTPTSDREPQVPIGVLPPPPRVLVVDDDKIVAQVLVRSLRGYDVVVARGAREALEQLARGERFDVILCDVMMPEMTGAELYLEITRTDPELARRFVFVTGGATRAEEMTFLANVGQPVLNKPFSARELRTFVERFLLACAP